MTIVSQRSTINYIIKDKRHNPCVKSVSTIVVKTLRQTLQICDTCLLFSLPGLCFLCVVGVFLQSGCVASLHWKIGSC